MGTITAYGSKHSHEFKLDVSETSTSTSNNTSEISFNFTLYKSSYSWSGYNSITYTLIINGTSYSGAIPNYNAGSTLTIKSGTQTISHNDDGSKTISYSFSVTDNSGQSYTCGNASASGSMDLTTISRYANLTSLSLKSRTINSITLQYTTDKAAWLFVNLNNGEGWLNGGQPFASNTTSGTITIDYKDRANTTRLDANTTYKISILCRASGAEGTLDTSKDITVTTYDIARITDAPNTNIGNSQTITWTNPSGATTSLKLCKTDNTQIIDYGSITGTSKTITPTASTIYALTPNSNTITLRYIITTTQNSISYTSYKDCIFTVTNSNPTFSNFTYQDTNTTITALTGNNQILVNGYSKIKATVSTSNKATAENSATMTSYKLVVGSQNTIVNYSSSANVDLSLTNPITNNVIDLYATDSRGNSTKVTKTATMKDYSNIKVTSLLATRENNVGQAVTLKFEAEFWNNSFGSVSNTITSCIYKYKTTSASSYTNGATTLTYTTSGNKITGSISIQGDLGASGFNVSNSYNIQLVVADKLSSATYTITLGSGNPALAIYKNNVAIGQKYNTSEGSKLQVNGNINIPINSAFKAGGESILRHTGSDTILSAKGASIYLRPKGNTDATNEVIVDNNGAISFSTNSYKSYGNIILAVSNAATWVCLGTLISAGDNSNIIIKIYSGNGYNANTSQNTYFTIVIKDGYQSTGSATSAFGVTVDGNYNWNTSIKVSVRATSYNTANVWVYLPWAYSSGCYSVEGRYGSWTHSGTAQTSAPTSGTEQSVAYFDKSGSYMTSLYDNSSGTNGTVTLSATSANFTFLEIFFKTSTSSVVSSTRIYSPNGKVAILSSGYFNSDQTTWTNALKQVTISGTTITPNYYSTWNNIWGSDGISFNKQQNEIYIIKVNGYM
jgi:hypothetical protein